MIKFFIYLVFFGLLFLVLSRIFDVGWGRWYLTISVKEEIIRSIQGKLEEEIKRGKSSIERKLRMKERERELNLHKRELNFQKDDGTQPKKRASGVRKKSVSGGQHKIGENVNDIENIIKKSIGAREMLKTDHKGEDDNSIENIIEKSIQ